MIANPPTGTVTFLFTDIEGSTRRWQDEPETMRALLVEHDAILRDVIDKWRGHLFKHTGDGVASVFASASDAVAAAVNAQARLHDVLSVRMGLHTGEAELRDGDYFGSTLNRCARLMGIAHGGQIVCGETTASLVRDRRDLRDLGEHRLRDLSRAERVWQVGGGEFAALRSLDMARTNLPLLGNAFVGRQLELDAIAKELVESRLVTLTGVGGVGKTRLALQVAGELLPRFADGVWLCELAAAANGEDMVHVVALALGVVQRQQMTLAESIVDFLRTRQMLVVLDNCEHLLDAAAELIEGVLAGAPQVRILATSREGFGIPEERVRPVRSLSISAERAESSDAVALFAERARAVDPQFVLDVASIPDVVEVCRRLDGIPLAIELAAARVTTMSPEEIVSHLDERFRLLTGGRRGRVERHQTLRAAIEWSYSALGDTERTVFDRLGVFPASFDENAAIAVSSTDGIERWDVIDALAGLVAKSMIGAERERNITRYQLLETLRHFSRDHADDLDGLRRRHATHYTAFAEQVGAGLLGRDEFAWRPRLAAELDNLRAAVGWALDSTSINDIALGVEALDALSIEAIMQLSWGIHTWAVPALARIDELDAVQRATMHATAAVDAYLSGDIDRARTLGRRAIADSVRFSAAYFVALCFVSTAEYALGNPDAAMAVLAGGRRLLESEGPVDWRIVLLHGITAYIADYVGDHDTAHTEAQHGLAIARQIGIPSLLANALGAQGHILCNKDPEEALANLNEAIALFEGGTADAQYYPALMNAAVLRAADSDTIGAARAARTALVQYARTGNRTNSADAVAISAIVFSDDSDRLEAAATVDGARHGPVFGQIPPTYSAIHQPRIDAALERVAAGLGPNAFANARQRGAAMSYDEIIAYTLDQLAHIIDQ